MGCSVRPRAAVILFVFALGLAPGGAGHCTAAGAEPRDAAPAAADTAGLLTLDPVLVTAPRPAGDPELTLRPGFARSYDLSEMRGLPRTVSDVLAGAVGVHVRRFGGVGSQSSVSVRGSSPGQVSVYLDGVPLNSAEYGSVNLADFPLEGLDRIEVYRGGAPVRFESAGGGVVNMISRAVDGVWGRASAGQGSFGTRQADVSAGWRRERLAALLVTQYLGTIGDFRYLDDNATPQNAGDDSVKSRANNRLESSALTARGEFGAGPCALDLTHDRSSRSQGTPGTGADPALEAHLRGDRSITNLRARWVGDGSARAPFAPRAPAIRLYQVTQRDRFRDPSGELTGLRQDNDDRTERTGAQGEAGFPLPGAQTVALVAEARRERYEPSILLPSPKPLPGSLRRVVVFGAEDRVGLFGDRIVFLGSLRRSATEDEFEGGPAYPGALPTRPFDRILRHSSWTLGTRVSLTGALALEVSRSRLARPPTLEELFGNRGGVYGNPAAKPEIVETRDVGLVLSAAPGRSDSRARPAWLEAEITAYRSDAADLLVFVQNSQRSSVAQNISAARQSGLELSGRASWRGGFGAEVSWTRQWTRDEGEIAYWRGKELPGRPRDEIAARFAFERSGWRASYEAQAVSENFLDRYNANRVPPRTLHDLGLAASPWRGAAEMFGELRNLTDRRAEDFAGFPLPGRTLYIGFRLHHDGKDLS